jgi:hypothetical protein
MSEPRKTAATVARDYWLLPLGPESMAAIASELLTAGNDSEALRPSCRNDVVG